MRCAACPEAGAEMAVSLWKRLLQTTKSRLFLQRGVSLYNGVHGFEEEVIKKKLQQFGGGSINLSKEDHGIRVLTLNNPKQMNAFTARERQKRSRRGSGSSRLAAVLTARLMTPGSEIRFVHKQMGLVPGWGGAARLVQIVGSGAALKLLSGALKVDPERAVHLGLAEETLPSSDETRSLEEAQAWLNQYTKAPAEVIQAVKKVVTAGRELQLEAALRAEKDIFGTVWGGPANLQALAQSTKRK
ncbi:Enoyl-CoA hydratase domain-containing protein 1 [Chelonia mydas]|uniref:Enoyl-CoA hydratase domain-containing protein 1 n=1 Tax=Chelonia mydas TaxID=8469 RepID=M7B344_CHEMY|nr:Enoyl-CoA hydratase domain-containing protein 1 [Chelonia mydas]